MKLLLDTHLLLWAAQGRLSARARKLVEDEANSLYFSAASLWEITIKVALGRDDFQVEPRLFRQALLDNGYAELPVSSKHAVAVIALPELHRDPFDRLLIAQAMEEGILLLTNDDAILAYPNVPARKV
ncbi:MAG: type II toxin-antitoxin system VapC family toxin [Steroidobacteraceae bacterium]